MRLPKEGLYSRNVADVKDTFGCSEKELEALVRKINAKRKNDPVTLFTWRDHHGAPHRFVGLASGKKGGLGS